MIEPHADATLERDDLKRVCIAYQTQFCMHNKICAYYKIVIEIRTIHFKPK